IVRQFEPMTGGEIARRIGFLADAAHDLEPRALALHRLDDCLAPAAEADDGGRYHPPAASPARPPALRRRHSSITTVASRSPSPWRTQPSSTAALSAHRGSSWPRRRASASISCASFSPCADRPCGAKSPVTILPPLLSITAE